MKNTALKLFVTAYAAFCALGASAQGFPQAGFSPIKVNPDNSLTLTVNAPEAKEIVLDIMMKRYPLSRNAEGVWTVTTPAMTPGFNYYSVIMDGVTIANPSDKLYQGYNRYSNGFEIKEAGCDEFHIQDVPHGTVTTLRYFSEVSKEWREVQVYTPYGYLSSKKRYPVLYLQHGGGEDQNGWINQGQAVNILDNLIAYGKAVPMIVVCANGNVPGGTQYSWEGTENFRNELIQNVIPAVEKNFRVKTDKKGRALAGLSMGGGQSFYTGLRSPEIFSNVGVFSAGMFSGFGRTGDFDLDKEIPGIISNAKEFSKDFDVFMMSCGEQDERITGTTKKIKEMQAAGVSLVWKTYPGDHEWQVWRKSLRDFVQLLFK